MSHTWEQIGENVDLDLPTGALYIWACGACNEQRTRIIDSEPPALGKCPKAEVQA